MTLEQIAKVAHEINKAYCHAIGDDSQLSWEEAPEWQRKSAEAGVRFCLENPSAPPSANHESWLKVKEAEGWKYGPVKNPETKEHPCYVPYEQLPIDQKTKDYLFKQVVESLRIKPISGTTAGQQAVDVSFNPNQSPAVAEVKQAFADAYDIVKKWHGIKMKELEGQQLQGAPVYDQIWNTGTWTAIALTEIQKTSMAAVKAVTR